MSKQTAKKAKDNALKAAIKKEPTLKDLKSMAFDLDMQMKRTQQQYNSVLQQIVQKQQPKK